MLSVGIVGAGYVAKVHMQVYSMLKDRVQVVAVCDTHSDSAKSLAAQYRVASVYDNHLDMLEKMAPDFVDICTPTSTHAQIATDSANKGSHILVEKPMARTSAECKTMAREAEKNNVSLCICHNQIFAPSFLRAKKVLADQNHRINLCSITSRIPEVNVQYWTGKGKEGGILWEGGTHAAYVQRFFLGQIDRVSAISKRVLCPVDDNFCVLTQSKSGAFGLIELSCWKARADWFHCSIDSEGGERFELDSSFDYFAITRPREYGTIGINWLAHVLGDARRFSQMRMGYAMKYLSSGRIRFTRRRHLMLIRQFIESLNNHSPPPVTAQDGVETIRTLEAIEESIQKGRPVSL